MRRVGAQAEAVRVLDVMMIGESPVAGERSVSADMIKGDLRPVFLLFTLL